MINFDRILKVISTTPSGDNLQPWKVEIISKKNRLLVFHEYKLGKHSFNPQNIASRISFGMMSFLIEEEALRQGYVAHITINEEGIESDVIPLLECYFELNLNSYRNLFTFEDTLNRKTSRGRYANKLIPLSSIRQYVEELNEQNSFIDLKVAKSLSSSSLDSIKKMEYAFWNKIDYVKEILHWVHFKKSSYEKNGRGFFWTELGLRRMDVPFVFLGKYMPKMATFIFNSFAHFFILSKLRRNIKSSNLLMLSLKHQPTSEEWFIIGKEMMKVHLKISKEGMVAQPLSIHTFFIGFTKWKINNTRWPDHLLEQLEINFKKDFKIDNDYTPFWLFRFGFEMDQDKKNKSIKLPDDILLKKKD